MEVCQNFFITIFKARISRSLNYVYCKQDFLLTHLLGIEILLDNRFVFQHAAFIITLVIR